MLFASLTAGETVTTESETTELLHEIQNPSETVEKANQLIDKLKDKIPDIINFGVNILIALIILFIGKLLINMLMKISKKFFERTKLEISVSKFLLSLIKAVAYALLVIVMLETVGIKTTSFVAVLTSASLAIGLALQGSLSNFAGGVLILMLKPFKIGDYIITSVDGMEGTVSKIDLFYTTLITSDNKLSVIPNGSLSNASLTNVTAFDVRRVDFQFGIGYGEDIQSAKEIMENCARKHKMVLQNKEIFAFVSNLDASQVTLGFRVWAKTTDYWSVKFELTESIKQALDDAGIEIPFNQIVVHTDSEVKS